MRQIIQLTAKNANLTEETTIDHLIAAMTQFMAADSDAEAVAEIDRDLKRAA